MASGPHNPVVNRTAHTVTLFHVNFREKHSAGVVHHAGVTDVTHSGGLYHVAHHKSLHSLVLRGESTTVHTVDRFGVATAHFTAAMVTSFDCHLCR